MKSQFRVLFTIAVFHAYFKNGACDCIDIIPDSETSSLMQRFGFIARNTINGLRVYGMAKSSFQGLFNYITSATGASAFSFIMATAHRSLFTVITDSPPGWKGKMIYDSHNGNNEQGGAVQLDGKITENMNTDSVGEINIRFSDLTPFFEQPDGAKFIIRYQARATQWNYYIIKKTSGDLVNPAVITRNGPPVFRAPENVLLENGENALLFSSGAMLLALSKIPLYRFSLVDEGLPGGNTAGKKTKGKMIYQFLPVPDPLAIAKEQNGNTTFSSPMFIYI